MDFSHFTNFVNGEPRTAKSSYHGINPATEEKLYDTPCASEQDLNEAVEAAHSAFPSWSKTPFEKRCQLVKDYADAFLKHEDAFTELLMKENGKPRALANREIHSTYECMVGTTTFRLPVETVEDDVKSVKLTYVPAGVVGAICPWNYPLLLSMTKIAPALVTGNCIIVKPSPFTPYTALKAVEVGQSIFPPGVLQVLGDDGNLGPLMAAHPGIQKISFTGSIPTGKKIVESSAKTLKKVTLELGGNDAAIIREDVDIETTAPAVALAAFKNSGQICVASKRIFVHESIYDEFLHAMAAFTDTLKVGDPFSSDDIDLGPVQNRMQFDKVQALFQDCRDNGYRFITGSKFLESSTNGVRKGFFIPPTIIASPPAASKIVTEEPFGPIVPIQSYSTEEEVIKAANDTQTGLGACIWSKDIPRAEKLAAQLEVGSVFINSPLRPDWRVYFAGRKESGLGGERGLQGLLEYCNPLAVHVYK